MREFTFGRNLSYQDRGWNVSGRSQSIWKEMTWMEFCMQQAIERGKFMIVHFWHWMNERGWRIGISSRIHFQAGNFMNEFWSSLLKN